MISKKELREYLNLKRELNQLNDRIKELRTIAESASAQKLTGMPGAHSDDSSVERNLIRISEMQDRYNKNLHRMLEEQERIEEAIARLPSLERQIIRYRYMDGYHWEQICILIGYEWTQTHEHHSRALRMLEKSE